MSWSGRRKAVKWSEKLQQRSLPGARNLVCCCHFQQEAVPGLLWVQCVQGGWRAAAPGCAQGASAAALWALQCLIWS